MKRKTIPGPPAALMLLVVAFLSAPEAVAVEPAAVTDELELTDFAAAITLTPKASGAIQTLLLPDAVYQGTVSEELSDLRVYNRAGLQVPHAIRPLAIRAERVIQSRTLPLFPLRLTPGAPDPSDALSLSATRNAGGLIVKIETPRINNKQAPGAKRGARASEPPGNIVAYIVDASTWDAPLDALSVSFEPGPGDYVLQVTVESSEDLSSFQTLGKSQSLVRLDYGGHSIERSRLALPHVSARYLRLTWAGKLPNPIASLSAESGRDESKEHLVSLEAPGKPGAEANTHVYDLKGSMPIDALRLVLTEDNVVVNGTLEGANAEAGPFRTLHQGTYYRVRHEGAVLESPKVTVPRSNVRFLRLRLSAQGGALGAETPVLEISRQPDQLLFTSRGEAPFELAFGHYAAVPSAFSAAELLKALPVAARSNLPKSSIQASSQRSIKGPSARLPPPPPPPLKKYLLWAVLIVAVLLLGVAARSLIKANKSEGNPP